MEVSPLTKSFLGIYLPSAAAAVCLATIYVHSEDPVYFWDWGMYWNMFRMLGGVASESAAKFSALTLQSISESDYNPSGLLPLLPVYWLFGSDRVTYVSAICALYVVPAALVAAYLAVKGRPASGPTWLAVISALLVPVLWNAALRGMIDVIGLIPLGLAASLLWNTRFLTRATRMDALRLGLLLWLPFLLRRWYAFSLVALIAVSVVAALWMVLANDAKEGRSALAAAARDVLGRWSIAGLAMILGLAILQWPLVDRILQTHYGDMYSAYQTSPWRQAAGYYANFGPVFTLLVAAGLAIDIRRRNWHSLFFFVVAVVTAMLFAAVQEPSVQHYLPIALLTFPVCFSAISCAWHGLARPFRLVVPALLALNFANTYVPASTGQLQALRNVLAGPANPPLRLDHYADYVRLTDDLLALGDGVRIAVFASSVDLSGSLLTAVNRSLRPRMLAVGEVDLRDHFAWAALDADYVVIGHPTQTHLDPLGQRVISIPAGEIAGGTGIGASFASTGRRYSLANGVVGEVFRRIRPIPEADLAAFKERFYDIYPQWRADDAAAAAQEAQ